MASRMPLVCVTSKFLLFTKYLIKSSSLHSPSVHGGEFFFMCVVQFIGNSARTALVATKQHSMSYEKNTRQATFASTVS